MSARPLSANPETLKEALLEFQAAPGRFSIALSEPRILFEQSLAVLTLAAARPEAQEDAHAPENAGVQQAARFFVRHVLLRPGTNHYALLGLPADAEPRTVREHYRLLIRLTHPDFASTSAPWPVNAASRVNLAYDVLSDPEKRSDYDQQLPIQQPHNVVHRPAAPLQPSRPKTKAAHAGAANPNRRPYIIGGLAVFAAVTMLVLFLASTPSKDESLHVAQAPSASRTPSAPRQEEVLAVEQLPSTHPYVEQAAQAQPTVVISPPAVASVHDQTRATQLALARQKAREVRIASAAQTQPADTPELVTLPLRLSLSIGMNAVSDPKPPAQVVKATTPLLVAVPPSSPPVSREAEPVAPSPERAATPLDMRHLHPLLAGLVETLQSGNGKQVQQWIEKASLQGGSASDFAEAYRKAIAGARVTGLGRVSFSPRAKSTPQLVDGSVQLNLQSADLQASVKTFRLRAYFEDLPSGPRLFKLEAE